MSSGLEVRRAEPADHSAILELCNATLGWADDARFRRLFEWKHLHNAFGASLAWVATHEGNVVGVRFFMQWEFAVEGTPVRAVRAVDTATHPDHQGRGIFTTLTLHGLDELQRDGVGFVFNTPNEKSRPGYLKMGWTEVGHLPAGVRFAGPRGALAAVRSRVPADLWSISTSIGVDFDTWQRANPTLLPEPTSDGVATLWTPERLRWRFEWDELAYRVFEYHNTALVVRSRHRGRALELVVALALGDTAPVSVDRAVRRALAASRASYALRLGEARPIRGVLPLPGGGPMLTWRAVGTATMPSLEAWHLSMGDIELF